MPRFYFHLYDGIVIKDPKGVELPDVERARQEAMQLASELLNTEAAKSELGTQWRVEVTDDQGAVLFRLSIAMSPLDPPELER